MLLLAKDGVFLPTAPRNITQGLLASGNRADVLINCPVGDFTFESPRTKTEAELCSRPVRPVGAKVPPIKYRDTCKIKGTLLHIRSVDRGLPPKCDLPEFEVNRPCCDCGRHSNLENLGSNGPKNTSAHPEFASRALADLVNLRGQEQEVAKAFVMGGNQDPYCGDLETGCGIGNATKGVWASPGNTLYFDANHVQYTLPVGKVVGIDLTFVESHPFHIHINP